MKLFTHVLTAALLTAAAANARSSEGPKITYGCVSPHATAYHTAIFQDGHFAFVTLVGGGTTDLDIYIYDQSGTLIAFGVGVTDRENVRFRPPRTGPYRLEIRNLGAASNRYVLVTY